jgi:hypothetical protein
VSLSASGSDPLGQLADEFLGRQRRGEQPALTEYTDRHPELAEQIRELFPALLLMEDVRPGQRTLVGAGVGPAGAGPLERLGEYRIVREIGRGGMGVVYEAVQESLGRRVALKVLPPGALGDARHVERFQREARAAARLHHSNIVPVFAVGEEGGTHYYAMQYIEGQPLDQVLAELRRLRAEAVPRAGPPAETPPPAVKSPPGDGAPAAASAEVARSLWQGQFRPAGGPDGAGAADAAAPDRPTQAAGPAGAPAAGSSGPLSDPHRPFVKSVAQLGVQVAEALRPRGRLLWPPFRPAPPLRQERGAARRAGGRGPGVRRRPGRPAPRRQALQPPPGRLGHRLADRLRPGQGQRHPRPDAPR